MRISTKIVFNLETFEVIERDSYEYSGPVAKLCGASGQESQEANSAQNLSQQLATNYGQRYGQQSQVLQNLQNSLQPLVSGGIGQQGFGAAEQAALNTAAINNAGSSAKNAEQAINSEFAGRGGGGTSGLVSGPQAAVNASILSSAANNLATNQNNNIIANYNQGRSNYLSGVGALGGVANAYAPNAGAAIQGNQNAFGEADQINQQNQAWESQLAGAITGGVSDFTTGMEGGGGISGGFKALAGG